MTTILATFLDTDPLGTTTDYTATVNWGDGTPTVSAMITEPAGPGLPFDVSQAAILGHTYAEEGNYVTTIVISDSGGSKTIVNGAVTVADAPWFPPDCRARRSSRREHRLAGQSRPFGP